LGLLKGNPAWWATALENAGKVQDKLAELADKYGGMDAWTEVANAVSVELADAVQQFKNKQVERFLQDDARELRSALNNVTMHLTQVRCVVSVAGLQRHVC
jgi:hypothetical protein